MGHAHPTPIGVVMRRFWSFGSLVFLGVWLALMLGGRSALFQDPGTFWHTRLGLETLASGRVVRHDTFTCSEAGSPWIDAQWLPECLMAAVYRCCGWDGLLLLAAVAIAATYAFLASKLTARGWNFAAALGVTALALGASSHQFHVRPLLVTIGLTAALQCTLLDIEAGRRGLRSLAVWIGLFVVWTNSHGGVLAGLGTLGCTVAGWMLFRAAGWPSPLKSRGDAMVCAMAATACFTAVLVNPYGLELPRGWWHVLQLPLPQIIQEHAPLNLREPLGWMTVLLAAVYLVALAGVPWRTWRATWLLPLVWLALTVMRVRNGPLFAVTAVAALGDVLPQCRWAAWLRRRDWLNDAPPAVAGRGCFARLLLPLAAVLVVAALQAGGVRLPVLGRDWVEFDARRWPVDLLPDLRAIEAAGGARTPIANDMLYGGFLIFHAPRLAVLIDDRCELFGRRMLLDYRRAETVAPELFDAWSRRYGCRWALMQNDAPPEVYFRGHPEWRLLRRGEGSSLYVRRGLAACGPPDA